MHDYSPQFFAPRQEYNEPGIQIQFTLTVQLMAASTVNTGECNSQ